LGAAHLAGVTGGLWTPHELENLDRPRELFTPQLAAADREQAHDRWRAALRRSRAEKLN
jgi:glycerol kinase